MTVTISVPTGMDGRACYRPPGTSGGAFEGTSYISDQSTNLRESLLRKLLSSDQSDNDDGEFLFNKLRKSPHLRKSLSAVNKARAFKYGYRSFGHKKWYKENFDIKEGLRSNEGTTMVYGHQPSLMQ